MGITISFAGIPKINAVKIYPSNPIILAKGSRKFEIIFKIDNPFILILAKSQITRPAGIATSIALNSINKHLSKIERTIIFP